MPKRRKEDDLPKPKQHLTQREGSLELDKNQGKIMVCLRLACGLRLIGTDVVVGGEGRWLAIHQVEVLVHQVTTVMSVGGLTRTALPISTMSTPAAVCLFALSPLSPHSLAQPTLKFNAALDLKHLGQTTRVKRSTLDQVRLRIAELREKSQAAAKAKAYDFEARLKEIKDSETDVRRTKREEKKRKRQLAQQPSAPEGQGQTEEEAQMAAMMGFSGFK